VAPAVLSFAASKFLGAVDKLRRLTPKDWLRLKLYGPRQLADQLPHVQDAVSGANEGLAGVANVGVFRQGTFSDPAIGWEGNYIKGKQWATDNPLTTPNYAQKYGLPSENTGNPNWIVGGRVQGPFTTRPAPASHNNPLNTGGATEVLPQDPSDVRLDWFHMPD